MRKLILTTILSACSLLIVSAQEEWALLPNNPNATSSIYDIEMFGGSTYKISHWNNGTNDVIQVDQFYPSAGSWSTVTSTTTSIFSKLKTEKIGQNIYIAAYDGASFFFYVFDASQGTLNTLTAPYPHTAVNNNWEFHAGRSNDELYVLYTTGTGPSDVHGLEYVAVGSTWTYVTPDVQTAQDLSVADLQIHSSATTVYFGVYSNKLRITQFTKGNIGTQFGYDGGLGEVYSQGASWNNPGFALVGDNSDLPSLYVTEDANNLSYDVTIDGLSTIDLTLTETATNFNLHADYLATETSPSHGFIMSMFSDNGVGNPNDKLFVIRKDFSQGGNWDTLATRLEPIGSNYDMDAFHLGIDDQYHHIAAAYSFQGSSTQEIRVYNNQPYLVPGTSVPNSGLCGGQMNELYAMVEIMDDDYEKVHIVNAYSLNAQTTNIQVLPYGFSNGISKFKILGIPSANNDQIVIEVSDNYSIKTITLDVYQGVTAPINLQFVADPVKLCSNEIQIDLSDKVNYYDQGTFRLNGVDLDGTLINAQTLNSIAPVGTLRYITNVNGCFVTALANYQIVSPPTANIVTNPTSCGNNNGSATVTVTAGTSSTTSFYWSTGETINTISNLAPGAYFVHVVDGFNCKATEIAAINASDASLSANVVQPSCHGVNDASIDLTVTSATPYSIIWSNGKTTEDVSQLWAGNYQVTYYDVNGCELTMQFDIVNPSPIEIDFTVNKPDCGASNGGIIANVTGGSGSLSYLWNTTQNTAAIINLDNGFYQVTVTDANNCVGKDSMHLNDNFAHIITDSIMLPGCFANNGGIDVTLTQHPQGGAINSITWSNGVTTEDNFNLFSGQYDLFVNSGPGCIASKTYTLGVRPPLKNDICIVSVDLATTSNLIIWEKAETQGISHYNIYRENGNAGQYMWIDTVLAGNLSVFNDVVASPLQRSWRYRISAVNECGVEGPYSSNHKTLHLNAINQVTPGLVDIYWDAYEGLSSGQYVVNRFSNENGWEALSPTIPFGATTQFTDNTTGLSGLDYYVDVELQIPCHATFKAQDFNRSRSNRDHGIFAPGHGDEQYSNNGITVHEGEVIITVLPNPVDEEFQVTVDGTSTKVTCQLFNTDGKLVLARTLEPGSQLIPAYMLQEGVYFLKFEFDGHQKIIKLVK